MKRFLGIAMVLTVALALAPDAGAKDLSIKAFYGAYSGSGIANTKDSLYFGITMRDLDVAIRPQGQGFRVQWTTVLRQGGTPDNPRVRRKSSAIDFLPTTNPRRFMSAGRTNPLSPNGLAWARLKDRTLTVYVLVIKDNGKYTLQSYARTVSGSGMDLKFTRIKDGAATRSVTGKLIKQSD